MKLVSEPQWHNVSGYMLNRIGGMKAAVKKPNLIDLATVALTADEKEAKRQDAITIAQTASANDFNASKAQYSSLVSDADATECIAKVTNPFNQAQVNAMKDCFKAKLAAQGTPVPADTPQGGGSGNDPVGPPDSAPAPGASTIVSGGGIMGFSWLQIGGAAVVLLVLSFAGWKYYQSKKTKSKPQTK